MPAQRWHRVKAVFQGALELAEPARSGYLDQECAPEQDLRAEVERLLAQHEGAGTFLDSLFGMGLVPPRDESGDQVFSAGETLAGRFQIVGFLGRGGMGEVYEAWDGEMNKRVALKTLRSTFAEDRSTAERFKREVRVALEVTHTNVCRVYGLYRCGVERNEIPFYTMELLDGEILDRHLKLRKRLSPSQALPVIRQLVAGLSALHEVGVVHRDFKPGNVIIVPGSTRKTRVVITDLGIAKSMVPEHGGIPATGSTFVIGTPDYMAPEQLKRGPLGSATDIYALGVVIHEMLTGELPLGGKVSVREHAPAVPESWERTIQACLERDPASRPARAVEVLEGLAGVDEVAGSGSEGVAPGPEMRASERDSGLLERMLRYRQLVIVGFVLVVLLAVLSYTGLRLGVPTDDVAFTSADILAVLPLRNVGGDPESQAFGDGLAEVVTSQLTGLRQDDQQLTVVPFSAVLSRDVGTADEAREQFGATLVIDGMLQGNETRMTLTVSLIDTETLFQRESAVVEGSTRAALDLRDRTVQAVIGFMGVDPDRAAGILKAPGRFPGEYEVYLRGRGYLARFDRKSNVREVITVFRGLVAQDPESALGHTGLAEALWRLHGHTLKATLLDEAEESAEKAARLDQGSPEVNLTLGIVRHSKGREREAALAFNRVLAAAPRSAEAYQGLGKVYEAQGRFEEAERALLNAIRLEPNYWVHHNRLGYFYYQRGRYRDAVESRKTVVRLTPDNVGAYNALAYGSYLAGDFTAARKYYLRSIDLGRKQRSEDPSARPHDITLSNLGEFLLEEGEYEDAETYLRESIEYEPNWHTPRGVLGEVYHARDGQEESRPYFEQAVQLAEQAVERSRNEATYAYLAGFHARLGNDEEAMEAIKEALSFQSKNPRVLARCGEVYAMLGRTEQALTLLRKAIQRGFLPQVLRRKPGLKQLTDRDWEKLEAEVDRSRASSRPQTL